MGIQRLYHLVTPHSMQFGDDISSPAQVNAINGIETDPTTANQRPIAIVVENHPDARPQAGLSQADIIYETLAEGGITRYLALFQTQSPDNIGPIRSARVYFAQIANDWHAVLVHVGGNSDALANIRDGVYKYIDDADQFFNDPYFHRIASRPAPHNVYSSIQKLRGLMTAKHYDSAATYFPWQFKNDNPAVPAAAAKITIPFSTPAYAVSYKYDAVTNSYARYVAGKVDRDVNNGKQIAAKNIIVQFADNFPTQTDTVGSISFKLNGPGKALVFLDGSAIEVTWKHTNGITQYYDETGKEVSFNRGQTWVEIVPPALETVVKWSAS
jgi:DUF3048 family protein